MSRALVLSGGAFRGAVQLPVIEYLFDQHEYDAVYGVSVGSINGVMFAQKELDVLRQFWEEVDGVEGFLRLKWYWPFIGIYSMKPLRKKIEERIALDKVQIPFTAGVSSFTDGEYYNLCTDYMNNNRQLWDAIEASSSMAGVMVPPRIKIFGKKHIGADGGFRNIIPIPKETCFDYLDVVTCTPLDRMKMKDKKFDTRNLISLLVRGVEIMQDEIFDQDLVALQNCDHATVRVFSPSENPGSQFDACRETIQYRFELGEGAISNPVILSD
jgi:predicted acylesterase/phospholipase RssA